MSTLRRHSTTATNDSGGTVPAEELLAFVQADAGGAARSGASAFDAVRYHLEAGGKRARHGLALQTARLLGIAEPDCRCLAACVELLHNSSLVFDDLQDRDETRRGRPAVWVEYGPDVALCAGALLLSGAYGALSQLSRPGRSAALVGHVHRRTATLIHGQTADLAAESCELSASDYEQIAAEKSGVLFALPLEMAALYAGRDDAMEGIQAASRALSIGYQITDDLADFVTDIAAGDSSRLNYVVVLDRSGGPEDAIAAARTRSLELLDEAHRGASSLPGGMGGPLADLASLLAGRA